MIAVAGLTARVGGFTLADVTFTVPTGGYGVVIGPAGSGKTTLIEAIAGVAPVAAGRVALGGREVTALPPERRGVGLVYQHGLLFPHLSVAANVAYGAASPAAAEDALARVGGTPLAARTVQGLSGGERQVVALARALARRPPVLLLDEPFSALDPRRRAEVRRAVRDWHRETGATVLQVTHEFAEAGMLGDVAVLLDGGRVLQVAPPAEIFRRPATPSVAEFLGAENVLSGVVRPVDELPPDWEEHEPAALAHGHRALAFIAGPLTLYAVGDVPAGPAHAVIRAEEVLVSREPPAGYARNRFEGVVAEVATLGALTRVTVAVQGTPVVASLTTRSARELGVVEGAVVWVSFKALAVHLC